MIDGKVSVQFQGREDGDPKLGIDRVLGFAENVSKEVRDESTPILYRYVSELAEERRGRPYPPPLPNQKYVRTYAMQQGYGWEQGGKNRAYYTQSVERRRYVVDREYQAAIHQGRHETMQEDIEDTLEDFVALLKTELLAKYAN